MPSAHASEPASAPLLRAQPAVVRRSTARSRRRQPPGRDPRRRPQAPIRDQRPRPRAPTRGQRPRPRAPIRDPLLQGRAVVWISAVTVASVALLDLLLTGRLSQLFDLSFVLVCMVAALAVRRRDLFTVAVLPPLLMGTLLAVVAMFAPAALSSHQVAFVGVLLTALAHHAAALVAGHGSALTVLVVRGTLTGEQPRRS